MQGRTRGVILRGMKMRDFDIKLFVKCSLRGCIVFLNNSPNVDFTDIPAVAG